MQPINEVGSTRDFKPAGSMLGNFFSSHVPSDLLLIEDAESIQIKQYFGSLAVCRFNMQKEYLFLSET